MVSPRSLSQRNPRKIISSLKARLFRSRAGVFQYLYGAKNAFENSRVVGTLIIVEYATKI